MIRSEQINELSQALAKAQGELEATKKDEEGYGYSYSTLASVIATAKPVLAKHGLAVSQGLGSSEDGKALVTTILMHVSGQFLQSETKVSIINMKGCNELQNYGASCSYARRYAYQAILGMSSEDNDASSNGPKEKQEVKQEEVPKRTSSFRTSKKPSEDII